MKFEIVKLALHLKSPPSVFKHFLFKKEQKHNINMEKTARIYESALLDEFVALENPELTAIVEKKMLLAAKIYEALQVQKISNRAFAERLTISPSLVTKWLSGQHNFTVDTLVKIERILGIELLYSEKIAA